nr:putative ribonuclease H-like domain-containing protein [Tanacetum cinerariifolium]
METVPDKDYIVLPLWTQDLPFFFSLKDSSGAGYKPLREEEKKDAGYILPIARIEAIRLFLAYALLKDFVVYQMDVKSAFLYGKIKEEVYICQTLGFEDPDFPDKVYKVKKALYELHQSPRAWYEALSTYLLDNGFQRGMIDKNLFIKWDKSDILLVQVYVDDIIFGSTRKEMCTEFEKKEYGIFISQDKYVNEILTKFGFSDVKTASTPMETHKTLLKDEKGKDIDEHFYRSMIKSLMYLTSSRPDIIFVVCSCARFQVNPKISHLHAMKRIFRYLKGQPKLGLWYPKDSPFDLEAYTDKYCFHSKTRHIKIRHHFIRDSNEKKLIQMIKIHTDKNVADLLTQAFDGTAKVKNINGEAKLHAKVDGKKVVISEASIRRYLRFRDKGEGKKRIFWKGHTSISYLMVQAQEELGEDIAVPTETHHTPTITQPSTSKPQKKQKPRKPRRQDIEEIQPSDPIINVVDEDLPEDTVLNLETTKTAQAKEIANLKKRFKRLEKKRKLRTHRLKRLYKVGLSARVESSADDESLDEEDLSKQRRISDIDANQDIYLVNVHKDEDIFGVNDQDDTSMFDADKDLQEPEMPLKKKAQISLDEEYAFKLQAKEDEQERIIREKAQQIEEVNLAWDGVQAKIKADYEMAYALLRLVKKQLKEEYRAN